jgi:hypothetical protein
VSGQVLRWTPRPDKERDARRARHKAREALWSHSTLKRVRLCGRAARASVVPVVVGDGVAHFRNLIRCASVHACPVCSPKIRQGRASEIERGVDRWISEDGGGAVFVTATLPHDAVDRLSDLYDGLAKGLRGMWSGSAWMSDRERFGIVGVIRTVEVTRGPSGWHPHVHALLLTARPLGARDVVRLRMRLRTRWAQSIERAGFRRPQGRLGLDTRRVYDVAGLAAYTAKLDGDVSTLGVALELTRHDLKAGRRESRTPWEILDALRQWGDVAELTLWQEYEQASHGKRSIVWSRGLKDRLGVNERTDDEIAEVQPIGEVVAVLSHAEWRMVCRIIAGPALVLDLAEVAGAHGVALALSELSKAQRPPP